MIVFELNRWTLEKGTTPTLSNHMVVRHACEHHKSGRALSVPKVYVYPDSATNCWRCTVPIPEGIIALYLLHEWDK